MKKNKGMIVGFLAPARGLFLDEVYYKEKSWKEE